jgi:hypothetical protein
MYVDIPHQDLRLAIQTVEKNGKEQDETAPVVLPTHLPLSIDSRRHLQKIKSAAPGNFLQQRSSRLNK